jgi:3-hydroxybutyryl-CoA dehydrogenase
MTVDLAPGDAVTVIGGGTMGSGIAQVFASSGYVTTVVDASEAARERATGTVAANLGRAVAKGRMSPEDRDGAIGRLTVAGDMAAVEGAALVIEAVFESMDAKSEVFREVARRLGPDAIVATNTSSLSVSALAPLTGAPDRFAGLHFFNPVPVLPLVEIVRGLATSDQTITALQGVAKALGKQGVVVRDSPGFVVNRILIPMINEAITCLDHAVADRDAIDETMRLGANHPIGPLALADLIGLDVCLDIMSSLHRDLGEDRYRPSPLLRRMVAAGYLGRKTGRGFHDYPRD